MRCTTSFLTICVLLILRSAPLYSQLPEGWTWQNPLPHGLTISDVVMLDEQRAVAACENGYIMRSHDGGLTWVIGKIAFVSITDLCASESGKLWASTEDGTILHSDDGGDSWSVQLTSSGGATGNTLVEMYDDLNGMAVIPRQNVFRTTNGGSTWEALPNPYAGQDYGKALCPKSLNTWYIIGSIGTMPRLYITTNFGSTWKLTGEIQTEGLNKLVFIDSLYGYQCRNGELLRTTNGGSDWTEMDIFGFGYVTGLAAGRHMGNKVYCLSEGMTIINASSDNGDSWNISLLEDAFRFASPSSMAFANETTGLVVGSGGRILRTDDGGMSWNVVHGVGFLGHIIDLVFTTPKVGIALSSTPAILLTSNGGNRWIESVAVEGYTLQKVSMYSENEGFAYGNKVDNLFTVYHTSDAGKSWESRGSILTTQSPQEYVFPQEMLAVSESELYIGFSYGRLYRSRDGGMTFDSLQLNQNLRNQYYSAMNIHLFDGHLILVSANGVSHSTDDGDTWSFFPTPSSRWMYYAEFLSESYGVAVSSGSFMKTTDGGDNWVVQQETGNELVHFFSIDTGVMYRSQFGNDGTQGSIRWTFDGGEHWEDHRLKERVSWDSWFWVNQQHGWTYGYGGLIRHSVSSGIVGIESQPSSIVPAAFRLETPYPNPVSLSRNGGCSFGIAVPEREASSTGNRHIVISLYDALGRPVMLPIERSVQTGYYTITLGGRELRGAPLRQPLTLVAVSGQDVQTKQIVLFE